MQRFNRQAAQNGIAVMSLRINGVFAVTAVVRQPLTQKIVMRLFGKTVYLIAARLMPALHFL